MPANDERWLDAEAGPVVRPYALTQGRTRHTGESFDLVATVMATPATEVLDRLFYVSIAMDVGGITVRSPIAGALMAVDGLGIRGRPEPRFRL